MIKKSFAKRSAASLSVIALVATMGIAAPAFAQEAPQAAEENEPDAIPGAIVVTARKREEDLLKTPVTVTALTSETLAVRGVVSMQSLANNTPGININNNSSGHADRSFQQISLRGFTPVSTLATTTSLFIDGVPIASPSPFTAISNPERIEILKGPQSAYFGRNTFAGAINVVNKAPSSEWTASVLGMAGTRDNYRVQGSVEGPIIGEALTFRLSGDYFTKNGSYTNPVDGKTLGDESSRTFTALVVAKPTERLTIKAFGMVARDHDGASASARIQARDIKKPDGTVLYASQSNCTINGNPYICGTLPGLVNPVSANTTVNSALRDWLANPQGRLISPKDGVQDYGLLRNTRHLHLVADYEVTDEVTASVLGGYNTEEWTTLIDLDGIDTRAIANAAYPNGYFDFPFLIERKTQDFSVEGRLAYDSGPFRAVTGVSFLKAQLIAGQGSQIFGGRPAFGGKSQSETLGAFFGLTYDFTDRLSASVEGRYQEDKISSFVGPNGQRVVSPVYVPAGTYAPFSLLAQKTFKNFTPRVIVNFQATPDFMVYGSVAKGVNPSQFNTFIVSQSDAIQQLAKDNGIPLAVDPEKITNFELGVKGRALDGAMRYTVAGYYSLWRDQITSYLFSVGSGLFSGSANAGSTDVYGIESEVFWKASDLITIDAAAAFNQTHINSFVAPAVTVLSGITDFRGKELPNTSKWSANVGVTFNGDLKGIDDGRWFVRGDWNFKSGMWSNQANIVKTPDLHLFNARLGVSKGDTSLELFVTNVFNTKTYTSIADNWVIDPALSFAKYNAVQVGLPELRTAGVQVRTKF